MLPEIKVRIIQNRGGLKIALASTKINDIIFTAASAVRISDQAFKPEISVNQALTRLAKVVSEYREGSNNSMPTLASALRVDRCTDVKTVDDALEKSQVILSGKERSKYSLFI